MVFDQNMKTPIGNTSFNVIDKPIHINSCKKKTKKSLYKSYIILLNCFYEHIRI